MESSAQKTRPIIVEKILNVPITKIWEAFTDLEKIRKWYFDIAAFEPKVGLNLNLPAAI